METIAPVVGRLVPDLEEEGLDNLFRRTSHGKPPFPTLGDGLYLDNIGGFLTLNLLLPDLELDPQKYLCVRLENDTPSFYACDEEQENVGVSTLGLDCSLPEAMIRIIRLFPTNEDTAVTIHNPHDDRIPRLLVHAYGFREIPSEMTTSSLLHDIASCFSA